MREGIRAGVNTPDWNGKSPHEACTVSSIRGYLGIEQNEVLRDEGRTTEDFIEQQMWDCASEDDSDDIDFDGIRSLMVEFGLVDKDGQPSLAAAAKRAGWSRDTVRALSLKAKGCSREEALSMCRSEAGRRRLQAAWRSLEPDRIKPTQVNSLIATLFGCELEKPDPQATVKPRSFIPPWEALAVAKRRQDTPVVHETYESLATKSHHVRWLQKTCQ
jgi:hypothetical protein